MIGLQDHLLQHELARHSIKFAVRFDLITHTFQSAFTLQYSVVSLLDVVDECLLLRMELLLLFVASQLNLSNRQSDAVLLRNRLQHLRRKDCCGSSCFASRQGRCNDAAKVDAFILVREWGTFGLSEA